MAQLTPPGPPTDSFKSLDEVEPRIPLSQETTPGDATYEYIINAPGSYYLTANTVVSKRFLLVSTAGDVTIDLMGYSVDDPSDSWALVLVSGGGGTCTIRNGSLLNGVTAITSNAPRLIVEDLHIGGGSGGGIVATNVAIIRDTTVFDTAANGILLSGSGPRGSEIRNTQVRNTGGTAITMPDNCVIENVLISDVPAGALSLGAFSRVSGLSVENFGDAGSGTSGVAIGSATRLRDSVFHNYKGTGAGLELAPSVLASGIEFLGASAGVAVVMSSNATLEDSVVVGSATSIDATSGFAIIKRCFVASSIPGIAIDAGGGCVIDENRMSGDVEIGGGNNIVTRNALESGTINNSGGPTNEIGPTNDLTSPWTNFQK
ncbi:MAG: hypothetical protein ACYTF7_03280 [Planctomycetota bacterium]